MDLKLCPACGQSVLDDDASLCPFCGSAMDGSDKGNRKPPAAKPGGTRPTAGGAAETSKAPRKSGERTSSTAKTSGSGKPEAKPVAQGVQGARGGKPKVDEDDPFGLGTVNPAVGVIQALAKPEKGHLHRVICPMCEKPGFVAKSAIGKQVRCANEKCMVPVFTVPDPDAPATDPLARRKQASAAADAAAAGSAKPRSPLVIYSIVGVVLLVLAVGLVQFLNRGPAVSPDLNQPVAIPEGGYGDDTLNTDPSSADATAAAKVDKEPAAEAERLVKRMIQIARLNANRDKAYARRLTADVYFRLSQPALGAQEFSQLLLIRRQSAYYQIEPRLRMYWLKKVAGDTPGARSELEQMLKDSATIPAIGRVALESVMGLASVLVVEGQMDEAAKLLASHQRDRSVVLNRDAMSTAAWFFTTTALRGAKKPSLAVTDVFMWVDPLHTAIAADLATRSRWSEALAWVKGSSGRNATTDSLAVIAELSAHGGAPATILAGIEAAAAAIHPMVALRVQSIIAAEQKSVERLQALTATVAAIQTKPAIVIPSIDQVLRMELPDSSMQKLTAAALTDYVRAASICGDSAAAEDGLRKLTATMFEYAPATAATRQAVLEVEQRDGDVKRRIETTLRITRDTEIGTTFRNYRRKIDQLALVAEERRLSLMQKLARIVRAGGVEAIRAVMKDDQSGLKQEVMVDELAGLLAAAATRSGNSIPEVERLDPALKVQLPDRTKELPEIAVGPLLVRAWELTKQGNLPAAMKTLSAGSNDLPGLREAVVSEIVDYAAHKAEKPDVVYAGIGQIANYPVWREEALQTSGRIFAQRGLQQAAEKWIESQSRMPATEQVTALYGLALGLIDKAAPVADADKAKKK